MTENKLTAARLDAMKNDPYFPSQEHVLTLIQMAKESLALREERDALRKALGECYVDIGALLMATTWELAPEVRKQLTKTQAEAERVLGKQGK